MKMNSNDLIKIVKEQCERIVTVLKMHAESTTCKKEMESYRSRANGKLSGIIEMTISIYATEYVNDDNAYWQKVDEIRTYEDEIQTRITKTFIEWYEEHLNNDGSDERSAQRPKSIDVGFRTFDDTLDNDLKKYFNYEIKRGLRQGTFTTVEKSGKYGKSEIYNIFSGFTTIENGFNEQARYYLYFIFIFIFRKDYFMLLLRLERS